MASSIWFLVSAENLEAAPGTLLSVFTTPVRCASGIGISVAFDGKDLFYTCVGDGRLFKISVTGTLLATKTVTVGGSPIRSGLGALAYDLSRKRLWAGSTNGSGQIYLVDPQTAEATPRFISPDHPLRFDDGLAWDPEDDTLWYSNDISCNVYHLSPADGAVLDSFDFCSLGTIARTFGNSGITLGLPVNGQSFLYMGTDGGGRILKVDKATKTQASIFASPGGRDEDMECDSITFPGKHAIWSKDAYSDQLFAFEVDVSTCSTPSEPSPPPPPPPPPIGPIVEAPSVTFWGALLLTALFVIFFVRMTLRALRPAR